MVGPGRYTVTLSKRHDGKTVKLAGPVDLDVVPLRKRGALPGADPQTVAAFWKRMATLSRSMSAVSQSMKETHERLERLELALDRSLAPPDALDDELDRLRKTLDELRETVHGSPTKSELRKEQPPTVSSRLSFASEGTRDSTYGPTPAHKESLELAEREMASVRKRLNTLVTKDLPAFEKRLRDAGAPWASGQPVP